MLIIAKTYSQAVKSAVIQQGILLVLTAMILDGGVIFQVCLYAAIAFWVGFTMIWIRNRRSPKPLDLLLIEAGYPVLCVVAFFLYSFIWARIG